MKRKASATLNSGRSAGIIISIAGALGLLLMLVTSAPRSTLFFTLFIVGGSLVVCFLSDCFARARITLTDTQVQLHIRRSGETVIFPWADFTCLYELPGWKMSIYLFTAAPLEKATQLAVYKACCKNREVPYTHHGCLILNAHAHGSTIDQFIPPHIQRMPWKSCAKL